METAFTPLASALGGALIGLAAVILMAGIGRIMGATGILAGAIQPVSRDEAVWRWALLAGMITGPLLLAGVTGALPDVNVPASTPMLVIGGVLVGVGATLGSGCTSGHGVCGLARLSVRSLVAVPVFMAVTAATVFLLRHVIGG